MDGVVDLGVEHQAVEVARGVAEDGEGGVRRGAVDLEARGSRGDAVAVAHPDLLAAGEEEAAEERVVGVALGRDEGAAELGGVAAFDPAAELRHHRLLAVVFAGSGPLQCSAAGFSRGVGSAGCPAHHCRTSSCGAASSPRLEG